MRYVKDWRFLPLNKYSGYENMAIDEFMVYYYENNRIPVLRLYLWESPTISVGKYQDVIKEINIDKCSEEDVYIIRRMTGGGAIFHNSELTYSLVCSEKDIKSDKLSVKETYERLNEFLLEMYRLLGLSAGFAKNLKKKKLGIRSPFCFSDCEEYDIIIKNKKIGGNAQCRKKNIIFQHGSIPFEINIEKIKKYFNFKINNNNFTTLCELLKKEIDVNEIEKVFLKAFKKVLKANLKAQNLLSSEKNKIDKLVLKKYGSDEWNLKGEKIESNS